MTAVAQFWHGSVSQRPLATVSAALAEWHRVFESGRSSSSLVWFPGGLVAWGSRATHPAVVIVPSTACSLSAAGPPDLADLRGTRPEQWTGPALLPEPLSTCLEGAIYNVFEPEDRPEGWDHRVFYPPCLGSGREPLRRGAHTTACSPVTRFTVWVGSPPVRPTPLLLLPPSWA